MGFPLSLIICALLLAGCVEKESPVGEKAGPREREAKVVSIAAVLDRRDLYRGREVTVSGKVTPGLAFEFVNEQPYLLDDGTARIWVITKTVVPEEGSWVTVRGRVVMPYQIKGRRYDIAIVETERKG